MLKEENHTLPYSARRIIEKKHLPMMGVGPVYVIVIIIVTVIAVIIEKNTAFQKGMVASLKIPLFVMGILLLILGV